MPIVTSGTGPSPALATQADVEGIFRALTPAETAIVPNLLAYISAQARIKIAALEERMATDVDFADLVRWTLASAVVRVLRNPEGWRQWAIDDANFTRDQIVSAGLLYLTDDELADLRGGVGLPSAYVVPLSG